MCTYAGDKNTNIIILVYKFTVGRLHYSNIHVLTHQGVSSYSLFRNLDLIGNLTESGMEFQTETPIVTILKQ